MGQISPNFRILGELRGRWEAFDFFKPALNPARGVTGDQNEYSFGALRTRLGIAMTTPYVDGLVQGEYTALFGLPDNAFGGLPIGPLGLGGAYYRDSGGSPNPGNVHLKQGYLNWKLASIGLPGAFLKAGRFEISDGLEYKTGDAKFDGLKTFRVSQRLIGPFDFTHATRNFDGLSLVYDQPDYNVTLSAVHPTQGGFNIKAQDQISHIDLAYGALTAKRGALIPGAEARLFYIYYGDDRAVLAVDNRPPAIRPRLNKSDLSLNTIGAHILGVQPWGPGQVDEMVWGAYQFGDWTNLNQSAYAFAVEGGYQLPDVMFKPWLRLGYYQSSGDSNAADGTHGSFFQIMPTVRIYAKFPFFNSMNIQDAFAQFIVAPTATTKLGIDIHHLQLTESSDLFYGGAGATSRVGALGYFGRNAQGNSNVGEMVDLSFTHNITKELSWSLYYAHAFGGDVTEAVYQKKGDADYGFLEFNLSL